MLKKLITLLFMSILLFSQDPSHAQGLNLSAQSYILMDESGGRVLVEKNAHTKMPMASTTKIMTALLALENSKLDDQILIDERSIDIEGSSIYLKNKERISMKDLLYGLMLNSGNDSAVAIANHICEDEEEFVNLMNQRARSLNALNTHFTNPHGLSHDDHYSTAYDLALITREALKHEMFREIVGSKSYKSNRKQDAYFVNKNMTLWEYPGGDGVKTGYTRAAGRCLVSTAQREGMRLIAVSLNAPDWFKDNYALLDYGFENYKPYTIYNRGQLMGKIQVGDDAVDLNLVAEKDLIYPLNQEETQSVKVSISPFKDIDLPIEKGQTLGKIETYLDGVLVKSDNLVAQKRVSKKTILDRLLDFIY